MAQTVWIACQVVGFRDWELNGIFTTKEAAAEVCDGANCLVVEFELDRDYTNVTEFKMLKPDEIAAATRLPY